ncbi:beta strand repeat-containing protein [Asaia astilbis]|uniref:beta strand repeat-containing protein n=1 Tax=Asaia astilbis TaxID=610244 RepID=UPI0012EB1CC3|nr:autotransporter-associated beta strand repeat-containing protein [Asaia astilbis]
MTNTQGATFEANGGTMATASNAGTMTLKTGNTVTGDLANSGDLTLNDNAINGKTTNTGALNALNATLANIDNNAGQATLTNSTADAVTNAQGAAFTATGGTLAQASNAGTMTLDAGNTVSGNVTNTGDLTLDGSTIKGTLAAQSGTFTVAPKVARLARLARANVRSGSTSAAKNNAEIGSLSGAGNGTLNGSLTLTAAEDDYSGVMSGPGGLTVEGGTQTLSGANTFTGNTTVARNAELILPGSLASEVINAGTMTVNSGEVGGNTANTGTINADNATFADIDNNAGQAVLTNSTANTVTNEQGATFTATGGKLASASNAGTMNLTAGNVVTGDVINSGDLSLDSNSIAGQTVNTGTLNAENATLTDLDNNAGQAAVINSSVGTVTNAQGAGFTAAGSRLTSASNAGTMALQSGNIVTGNVINNGDLTLDGSSIRGTLAAQSGTFTISPGNAQAGSLSGAGNGTLNGSLNLTNAVDTYSGVMSGPGSLTITGGTQTLAGDNTYTGTTKVSSGALYVNGNQQAATGATTVSAGALVGGSGTIGGDVYIGDNGTLLPGASRTTVGTLTINGNLTLAGNAVQNFSFGQAYTEGGQYNDLVRVKGNLNFGGILNLTAPSSGPDVERIAHGFGFGNGVYRVYTYGGTLAGAQIARLGLVSPATGTTIGLQTAVNHQINLIVSDGTLTFWDGGNTKNHGTDGSSGNGTIDGGDGSWTALNGAGDNNWTDAAGSRNQPWAQKQFAIFEGPAGKVTVIGKDTNGSPAKVMFSGMQFANNDGSAYTITGDDLYATTARTVIRVGDGTGLGSKITANLDTVIDDRDVKGGTSLVKSDAGSLVITKDQSYSGATEIEGGTLQLGNGGTSGQISSSSAIHNDGVLAIDHSNAVTLAQAIDGKGSLVQSGSGTTTLTGQNSYSGKTSIARGTLKGSGRSFGSSAIDIGEEGTLALDEQGRSTFDNTISGAGLLKKLGTGTSVLTRDNDSFSGAVDVTEGDLSINGSMRSATFNARQGGTLSGTGTLGKTTIGADGRLSPAGSGSLGELTVDGNLTMQQGSTLLWTATVSRRV